MALIESGIGRIPIGRWAVSQKGRDEAWRQAAIESERRRAFLGLPLTNPADPELRALYDRALNKTLSPRPPRPLRYSSVTRLVPKRNFNHSSRVGA
jgi:hypothetical protein